MSKKKKIVKFDETNEVSPDIFRDLSSIESYFDTMIENKNIKPSDEIPDEVSTSVFDTIPEKYLEQMNGITNEGKTLEHTSPEPCRHSNEVTLESIKHKFYFDNIKRLHFRDDLIGDVCVNTDEIETNNLDMDIDDDHMISILDKLFLAFVSTKTPIFVTTKNFAKEKLTENSLYGITKDTMYPYVLIDYDANGLMDNPMVLAYDIDSNLKKEYYDCIQNLIMICNSSNYKVLLILSKLLKECEEKCFLSQLNDTEFSVYDEITKSNIDIYFKKLAAYIKCNYILIEGKADENYSLDQAFYNIYTDIRNYDEILSVINPDVPESTESSVDVGGVSNDDEPFPGYDTEESGETEETRCDEDAEQEEPEEELAEEVSEEEVETEIEEDGFDKTSEDEEIDSINIEEAEEFEEEDMVVPVRRDN